MDGSLSDAGQGGVGSLRRVCGRDSYYGRCFGEWSSRVVSRGEVHGDDLRDGDVQRGWC